MSEFGAQVVVAGKDEVERVNITAMNGGDAFVRLSKDSKLHAGISTDKNGGRVIVSSGDRESVVSVSIGEFGGRLNVFEKGVNDNNSRVAIGVNEHGNGAISLWNEDGYREW